MAQRAQRVGEVYAQRARRRQITQRSTSTALPFSRKLEVPYPIKNHVPYSLSSPASQLDEQHPLRNASVVEASPTTAGNKDYDICVDSLLRIVGGRWRWR